MEVVFIKPKDGIRIVDPKTMVPVPAEGKNVEFNKFWSRRVKDGSIEIVKKGSK